MILSLFSVSRKNSIKVECFSMIFCGRSIHSNVYDQMVVVDVQSNFVIDYDMVDICWVVVATICLLKIVSWAP